MCECYRNAWGRQSRVEENVFYQSPGSGAEGSLKTALNYAGKSQFGLKPSHEQENREELSPLPPFHTHTVLLLLGFRFHFIHNFDQMALIFH